MQFDWWTFALQGVNFLVLVWLLWRFLYRPVKQVIEERKELAQRAFTDAENEKAAAEAARQRFEEAQAELLKERQDMLKQVHEELDAERRKILEKAKHEADELLQAAGQSIVKEREAAVTEVREQVAALAVDLASCLLGKVGSSVSAGVFLERLDRQLNDLPPEERDRLRLDFAADGACLTVVTAAPLAPDERDQWTDRLGNSLSHKNNIDYATDPEILGGAELRFPHAEIKFTWADQLRKARQLLRNDEAAQ